MNTDLSDIIDLVQQLLVAVVPVVIGLALVGVLWGLAQYALAAGNEEAKERGTRIMFWGVITLFIMVSIWGLVAVLQETVFGEGTDITTPPDLPELREQ